MTDNNDEPDSDPSSNTTASAGVTSEPDDQTKTITTLSYPRLFPLMMLPSSLHSSSTLVGSSGLQQAQSRHVDLNLPWRNMCDCHRGIWEIRWGLAPSHSLGDWMLVKWVTSSNPVFTAAEILFLAKDLLERRSVEFPNAPNREALLMRLLQKITYGYNHGLRKPQRTLSVLKDFNVGNRLQNIMQGSNTLD